MRVHDAGDLPPTIPFWLGEAPARTAELSEEVGALRGRTRAAAGRRRRRGGERAVRPEPGCPRTSPTRWSAYLGAGLAALGVLPTRDHIVIERVFDESEGTQLIIHAPYGGRINRALGLALRKRFCVSFDFELQAAADDDTVVLSLGPQHSFPLAQVPKMLHSTTATEVLTQAILPHPMLAARWRWNLNRALVVPAPWGPTPTDPSAAHGGRRPAGRGLAGPGRLSGERRPRPRARARPRPRAPVGHRLPDRALDAAGLVALLDDLESGRVGVHLVESSEPSPLAHGILTGRPFTFFDGAPLEERRTGPSRSAGGSDRMGAGGLRSAASELGPSMTPPSPRCSIRCGRGRGTGRTA